MPEPLTPERPRCKNTRWNHAASTLKKHEGYCFECWNLGVADFQDEIDRLRAELAACQLQVSILEKAMQTPFKCAKCGSGLGRNAPEIERELAEVHAYLTGKGEMAYCMTHPTDEPDTELGKTAKKLVGELAACRAALGAVWGQNVRVTDAGGWYITGRDGILLGPFNSQQAALDASAPPPEAAT